MAHRLFRLVILLSLAIAMGLTACGQTEAPAPDETEEPAENSATDGQEVGSVADMQDIIDQYLDGTTSASEFAISYHIGDSFSGETDLQLAGDGQYALWSTVTQGRQHREYSGQVAAERVQEIARRMEEVELWKVQHPRSKPGEDDPEAIIGVEAGGGRDEVVLWVSEIADSAHFSEVQDMLLALVHEVSGGEVLEAGR